MNMSKHYIEQMLWKTLLACAILLSGISHSAESEITLPLFRAINERLEYMEDVALFKAQNEIPIEDIEREQIVLEDAKELATSLGLNAQSMEEFFIAQIDAAKTIQYRYSAELVTPGAPSKAIDLNEEIRPALDRLSIEIVGLFAEFLRAGNTMIEDYRGSFAVALRSNYLSAQDKNALFSAMRQVRLEQKP